MLPPLSDMTLFTVST